MTKTYLLGVGCQKGGTTWVHDYLDRHPQADMGLKKEHHVFDALFVPEMSARYGQPVTRLLRFLGGQGPEPDRGTLRVVSFLLDLDNYFDHFHYRLLRRPEVRLAGDITPSYAGLPVKALTLIRDGFARRGVPVKVLFVLRDPVERCWSQVRMERRQACERDGAAPAMNDEAHLLAAHATDPYEMRTGYDRTLARLEQVFAPEDVHVALYETLFTGESLEALCGFLGIDAVPAELDRRVHASPKSGELSSETVNTVATHYAPVYADAARRFGDETIAALWPSSAGLGVLQG